MFNKTIEIFTSKYTILFSLTCFTLIVISIDLAIPLAIHILSPIFGSSIVDNEKTQMYNMILNNKHLLNNWLFLFLANNMGLINSSLSILCFVFYVIKNITPKLIIFYDITSLTLKLLITSVDVSLLSNFVYRKIDINSDFLLLAT